MQLNAEHLKNVLQRLVTEAVLTPARAVGTVSLCKILLTCS